MECSSLIPTVCFDPSGGPGFHNASIALILMASFLWIVYRLQQIFQFYEMIKIMEEDGKVIYLPSLGPYSNDLKKLMKIHVSQIIRERCSMSAKPLKKVLIMSAIDETTIKTKLVPNSSSSSNPDESYSLDISFKIDSDLPFTVQLFWGVEYEKAKRLIFDIKKEEIEFNQVEHGLDFRRMALGSSSAILNQIKGKCDDIEYNEQNQNIYELNSKELDLSSPIDFSPRNSIMTLAQVNPILYTSVLNTNDCNGSNNTRENYTNSSSKNVLKYIKNRFHDNFSNSNSNTFNSRWNSSVLGNHAFLLSKTLKRIINRFIYRINNIDETTTESLLEFSTQVNNINTKKVSKLTNNNVISNFRDGNSNTSDGLNPFYTSPIKFYKKGLSQEYNDKINLTPEYINCCNLLSPYYNYESESDHEKCNLNEVDFANYDIYQSKELGIKKIPLLILIKSNLEELDENIVGRISNFENVRESLTICNTILLHFHLIQDHYNIPYLMYKPILLKQTFSNICGNLIEPYDIYGLEDEELDCLICMSNPRDVVLLPCRHCISCEFCLRSLRQDKCPLCRTTFYGFVVLPIKNT